MKTSVDSVLKIGITRGTGTYELYEMDSIPFGKVSLGLMTVGTLC